MAKPSQSVLFYYFSSESNVEVYPGCTAMDSVSLELKVLGPLCKNLMSVAWSFNLYFEVNVHDSEDYVILRATFIFARLIMYFPHY